jgi:hypothetical protein
MIFQNHCDSTRTTNNVLVFETYRPGKMTAACAYRKLKKVKAADDSRRKRLGIVIVKRRIRCLGLCNPITFARCSATMKQSVQRVGDVFKGICTSLTRIYASCPHARCFASSRCLASTRLIRGVCAWQSAQDLPAASLLASFCTSWTAVVPLQVNGSYEVMMADERYGCVADGLGTHVTREPVLRPSRQPQTARNHKRFRRPGMIHFTLLATSPMYFRNPLILGYHLDFSHGAKL